MVTELFIRGRKLAVVFMTQSYFAVAKKLDQILNNVLL